MAWSGAELRARLWRLGLSAQGFATYTGRDLRTVERAITGRSERVSAPMIDQVLELERLQRLQLERWDETTDSGVPIQIPRLNKTQVAGSLPPQWWLALAAAHIAARGEEAQIEWVDQ